jgi:hypothetical protein
MESSSDETLPLEARLEQAQPPSWSSLICFGLASRIVTLAVGLLVAHFLPHPPNEGPVVKLLEIYPQTNHLPELSQGSRNWIEPWYRWDAIWIAEIARHDYSYVPGVKCTPPFMPLLPVCMAAGEAVGLDPYWVGLIVPNLVFGLALAFFGRLAFDATGDATLAWRACWLLVCFPTAFFFSAPYNESFGLLFTTMAVWAWKRERLGLACVAAALAGTARITAVAVGLGAGLAWLLGRRGERPSFWRVVVFGLSNIAGVLGYYSYLAYRTGEFWASTKSVAAWGRLPPSLEGFQVTLEWVTDLRVIGIESLITVGFLVLAVRAWWKRGALEGTLIVVPILQVASTGFLQSVHRYALSAFPAFVELADLLRSRLLFRMACAGSLLLQLLYLDRYVHWVFGG